MTIFISIFWHWYSNCQSKQLIFDKYKVLSNILQYVEISNQVNYFENNISTARFL